MLQDVNINLIDLSDTPLPKVVLVSLIQWFTWQTSWTLYVHNINMQAIQEHIFFYKQLLEFLNIDAQICPKIKQLLSNSWGSIWSKYISEWYSLSIQNFYKNNFIRTASLTIWKFISENSC